MQYYYPRSKLQKRGNYIGAMQHCFSDCLRHRFDVFMCVCVCVCVCFSYSLFIKIEENHLRFFLTKKNWGGLDKKIAEIRHQLDEAKSLRAEAEVLRDEYAAKIAGAEKDAEAMMDGARREADTILAKAESDGEKMIERRQRMAEEKISAAEREAVNDVRKRAVDAAAKASRNLIAERHDKAADSMLADEVISSL